MLFLYKGFWTLLPGFVLELQRLWFLKIPRWWSQLWRRQEEQDKHVCIVMAYSRGITRLLSVSRVSSGSLTKSHRIFIVRKFLSKHPKRPGIRDTLHFHSNSSWKSSSRILLPLLLIFAYVCDMNLCIYMILCVWVHVCLCENACENRRLAQGVILGHFLLYSLNELRTWASQANQNLLTL